jgi:hypothetical protein
MESEMNFVDACLHCLSLFHLEMETRDPVILQHIFDLSHFRLVLSFKLPDP